MLLSRKIDKYVIEMSDLRQFGQLKISIETTGNKGGGVFGRLLVR